MAIGTYNPELETALDRVRFAVGDTTVEDDAAIKPDEEYLAVIAAEETEQAAIATMATALAAQVMQDPDSYSESGGISITWKDRIKTWLDIAKTASERAAVAADGAGQTSSSRATRYSAAARAEYLRPETWPFWTGDRY